MWEKNFDSHPGNWRVKRRCFHSLVAFCAVQVPLVACPSNSFVHSVDLKACFELTPPQVCPVFHHQVSGDPPVLRILFQCLLRTSHSNLWFLNGKHYTSVTLKFNILPITGRVQRQEYSANSSWPIWWIRSEICYI